MFMKPYLVPGFIRLLTVLLLAACSQAGNPTPAGLALAGGGGGTGAGGVGSGGTTISALLASGNTLAAKFPTMARLQLSVTGPGGTAGIPMQLNMPTNGQAIPIILPLGVPLTFTFDVFDAAGIYLGTGTSTLTLLAGVNPVIPVNVNPVAPGTPYVDPITGLTGPGPVLALTVSVMTGASQQPVANAVVSLGATGNVTALTNASGVVNFAGVPMPQDVHVFANGDGVSVLAFQGSALAVPMPESAAVPATVLVNSPAGPTLAAGELLDVYLTDGMMVQTIGGFAGDVSPLRNAAIYPMRGPVGISAMIENPGDLNPRPDHGLVVATAAGHHSILPLNMAVADPAVQAIYTPQGKRASVTMPVTGMPISYIDAQVFAINTGGLYHLVSHNDSTVLPANQRDLSIWPMPAISYVGHILASDTYAQSEAWQRRALAASLMTLPVTCPPVPSVSAATAASVSWIDSAAHAFDGFTVQLDQGLHRWQIFGLQTPFATAITLPTVPAAATSPLLTGVPATARVDEYVLDPAAGFLAASPDLWFLPRMLNERARSASFPFTP